MSPRPGLMHIPLITAATCLMSPLVPSVDPRDCSMSASVLRPSVAVFEEGHSENDMSTTGSEVAGMSRPFFATMGGQLRPPNISTRTESSSSTVYAQETPKKRWQSVSVHFIAAACYGL